MKLSAICTMSFRTSITLLSGWAFSPSAVIHRPSTIATTTTERIVLLLESELTMLEGTALTTVTSGL